MVVHLELDDVAVTSGFSDQPIDSNLFFEDDEK